MKNIKIIIITQGLSKIVRPIVDNYNIVGVIESFPKNYIEKKESILKKIIKKIFFLQKIKTLKEFCKHNNIPYYSMLKNSLEVKEWIFDKQPDIIIIYSMSNLLKEEIFTLPKYGTLNLHPSLLPKYRGPNPWFWQYYNIEKEVGATLHFIDKGEDTGDIVYQESLQIPLGMKFPLLQDIVIGGLGVKMIFKALENIENLPRIKQPIKSPTKRAKSILKNEHQTIIDWKNWNIERIWHILRGTELWLNAIEQPKGIYKGQRWIVENYKKCDMLKYKVSKVYKENGKYFVACKDGKIYLSIKFNFKIFFKNLILKIIR